MMYILTVMNQTERGQRSEAYFNVSHYHNFLIRVDRNITFLLAHHHFEEHLKRMLTLIL